ncbi:hypothetical protein Micbo1qcDRAFT_194540 [Microdochium bolleyi]|uniref:BRCT domain-containing protein n=1 Tax=Microdochium bolleyi TaxID=196109 RepID=A0A136J8E6_9PEZI|nr:hypothetical protein Micbo1qcDRAFT_194540 [Microdochium bolleyi]
MTTTPSGAGPDGDTSQARDLRLSATTTARGAESAVSQNERTESQMSEIFFRELCSKHLVVSIRPSTSQNHVQSRMAVRETIAPVVTAPRSIWQLHYSRRLRYMGRNTIKHSFVNNHASAPITSEVQQQQRHSFPPGHRRQPVIEHPSSVLQDASSSLTRQLCISADNAAKQSDIGQPLRPLNGIEGEEKPPLARPDDPRSKKRRSTMDYSQSPTQSNEGRSYDQYNDDDDECPDLGSESPGHRTLLDNDTGAVKFDLLGNTDTQLTRGDPFTDPAEDLDSQPLTEWHPRSQSLEAPEPPDTSFTNRYHARSLPPETPAPAVQNPFAVKGHGGATVFGASQLFEQCTSAVKAASPTSSRPSPFYMDNNTISPNHAVSSPLKDKFLRTSPVSHGAVSSPALLDPSSRAHELTTSQDHHEGAQRRDVPLSSELKPKPPKRSKLDPIDEYRSVQGFEIASSRRRQSSEQEDSDSDADLALDRRQRLAREKQKKAMKSLASITFPAPQMPTQSHSRSSSTDDKSLGRPIHEAEEEDVEVPSTNRAKSKASKDHTEASPTLGHLNTDPLGPEGDSQETVADSQQAQNTAQGGRAVLGAEDQPSSPPGCPPNIVSTHREAVFVADTIPETSPAGTATAEYAKDFTRPRISIPASNSTAPSLPPLPSTEPPPGTDGSGVDGQIRREAEIIKDVIVSSPFAPGLRSSPTVILASSQRVVTRSSRRIKQINSPAFPQLPPSSDASSRTSSLSSLSATPPRPSSATPNTEHEVQEPLDNVSSPAVAKFQRRGRPSSSAPKQKITTYSMSPRSTSRASSRLSRASSVDVSVKSPAKRRQTEMRLNVAKSRKSLRQTSTAQVSLQESTASIATNEKIFQGMTFAVTFQSKQRHEDDERFKARVSQNKALKDSIVKEGGVVLSDGFDALFRLDSFGNRTNTISALSSSMSPVNPEMGFTALIADEHSRKAKYIQALALGLPCLAPRWITTCVAKRKLVDWSSYLLCAGQSSFLGEAIRSRNLPFYDPTTSKLVKVIEQRPKLLENTEVLVVLKRTTKEDNMPYLFLVQVLGATLTRVHTLDEARAVLVQRQDAGDPFHWVYVGDRLTDVDTVLYGDPARSGTAKEAAGARKRKRSTKASTASANTSMAQATDQEGARPPKRVRTLDDELVVQSLILGRLIEEDEMPL